jgi:hypothetical protein
LTEPRLDIWQFATRALTQYKPGVDPNLQRLWRQTGEDLQHDHAPEPALVMEVDVNRGEGRIRKPHFLQITIADECHVVGHVPAARLESAQGPKSEKVIGSVHCIEIASSIKKASQCRCPGLSCVDCSRKDSQAWVFLQTGNPVGDLVT